MTNLDRMPAAVDTSTDYTREDLPGTQVTVDELRLLGFRPFDISVTRRKVALPSGTGVDWNTNGTIPGGPGLYAFTVENEHELRVTYVGLTLDLCMVTKGQLSTGGGRGGQRYGRPTHAGVTRVRINVLVAAQLERGHKVRHWLHRHLAAPGANVQAELRRAEEELIVRWRLRRTGWNRG